MRSIGFLLYCLAQRSMFLLHVVVVRSHRSQNIVNCTSPTLRFSFFLFFRPLFSRLLFPFLWSSSSPMLLLPSSQKIKKSSEFWLILCKRSLFCILLINFPGGVFCKVCSYAEGGERIHSCQQWVYHLVSAILDIVLLTI